MQNTPEPALMIAHISGYTSDLARVELDHAQDILADLMDTVVIAFRPTFRLARLKGDAAFVDAIEPTVDGSALQDAAAAEPELPLSTGRFLTTPVESAGVRSS